MLLRDVVFPAPTVSSAAHCVVEQIKSEYSGALAAAQFTAAAAAREQSGEDAGQLVALRAEVLALKQQLEQVREFCLFCLAVVFR